jgi:hypothetical protein
MVFYINKRPNAKGYYNLVVNNSALELVSLPDAYYVSVNSGIDEVVTHPSFRIYPNPANDLLFIKMENTNEEVEQIIITDILGREIFDQQKPVLQNGSIQFDTKKLQLGSGTYFINLRTCNGNYCRKILVE